jgi:hypothetical protein
VATEESVEAVVARIDCVVLDALLFRQDAVELALETSAQRHLDRLFVKQQEMLAVDFLVVAVNNLPY